MTLSTYRKFYKSLQINFSILAGVFTSKPIAAGQFLGIYGGKYITSVSYAKRKKEVSAIRKLTGERGHLYFVLIGNESHPPYYVLDGNEMQDTDNWG